MTYSSQVVWCPDTQDGNLLIMNQPPQLKPGYHDNLTSE
jgi:hypothetical protein